MCFFFKRESTSSLFSAYPTRNALLIKLPTELRRRNLVDARRLSIASRRRTCEKRARDAYHVPTGLPLCNATVGGRACAVVH